jgi:hypothetical protein
MRLRGVPPNLGASNLAAVSFLIAECPTWAPLTSVAESWVLSFAGIEAP